MSLLHQKTCIFSTIICVFLYSLCASSVYGKNDHATVPLYEFSRVVDGDTIELFRNVSVTDRFLRRLKRILHIRVPHITVRMLGINSPESVDPKRPVECGGKEASDTLRNLLVKANKYDIRLISDSTQPATDVFGRILAYVELQGENNHTDLGLEMLRLGYAREFTYNKAYDRRTRYITAQEEAKARNLGIWSREICPNSARTKP